MTIKKLHFFSGMLIALFVFAHLVNHMFSIVSAEKHIEVMKALRVVYRNPIAETVLLTCVLLQIISGIKLFRRNRKLATSFFEKLHVWTGLYLAFFLVIHVAAVLAGRFILHLGTNFYFGVAGLNSFPSMLFFIPYYGLAIIAFSGHVASVHAKKMKKILLGLSPLKQSMIIFVFGIITTVVLFYGLTNHFRGVEIPSEYGILIGR